jgi:hypothetical protein
MRGRVLDNVDMGLCDVATECEHPTSHFQMLVLCECVVDLRIVSFEICLLHVLGLSALSSEVHVFRDYAVDIGVSIFHVHVFCKHMMKLLLRNKRGIPGCQRQTGYL